MDQPLVRSCADSAETPSHEDFYTAIDIPSPFTPISPALSSHCYLHLLLYAHGPLDLNSAPRQGVRFAQEEANLETKLTESIRGCRPPARLGDMNATRGAHVRTPAMSHGWPNVRFHGRMRLVCKAWDAFETTVWAEHFAPSRAYLFWATLVEQVVPEARQFACMREQAMQRSQGTGNPFGTKEFWGMKWFDYFLWMIGGCIVGILMGLSMLANWVDGGPIRHLSPLLLALPFAAPSWWFLTTASLRWCLRAGWKVRSDWQQLRKEAKFKARIEDVLQPLQLSTIQAKKFKLSNRHSILGFDTQQEQHITFSLIDKLVVTVHPDRRSTPGMMTQLGCNHGLTDMLQFPRHKLRDETFCCNVCTIRLQCLHKNLFGCHQCGFYVCRDCSDCYTTVNDQDIHITKPRFDLSFSPSPTFQFCEPTMAQLIVSLPISVAAVSPVLFASHVRPMLAFVPAIMGAAIGCVSITYRLWKALEFQEARAKDPGYLWCELVFWLIHVFPLIPLFAILSCIFEGFITVSTTSGWAMVLIPVWVLSFVLSVIWPLVGLGSNVYSVCIRPDSGVRSWTEMSVTLKVSFVSSGVATCLAIVCLNYALVVICYKAVGKWDGSWTDCSWIFGGGLLGIFVFLVWNARTAFK